MLLVLQLILRVVALIGAAVPLSGIRPGQRKEPGMEAANTSLGGASGLRQPKQDRADPDAEAGLDGTRGP
jgi:hypothetical protein